jgi:hypothetical protein
MENRNKWLLAIFVFTLGLRLLLAFSVDNLTYDSYYNVRQVESIKDDGLPLFDDDLSYSGRDIRFLPFFDYFMAFFALFLPVLVVAKLIPNILISLLVVLAYFISFKITKNEKASLVSSLIVGILPILFQTNKFGIESLFLPLIFLSIYSFMNIDKKQYMYVYVASFLLLSITSSATILLILGFLIYIVLSFIEYKKINRSEMELILFSVFFYTWMQFIFFKEVLINEGFDFIWQNIPTEIILNYLPRLTILEALVLVGIIPFVTGIYVVYQSLFKSKYRNTLLIISLSVSTTILVWLRVIEFTFSLAFFGVMLAILFSVFFKQILLYLKKTKFSKCQNYLIILTIILIIPSAVIPSISYALNQDTPSDIDIEPFLWIEQNTPKQSGITSTLREGHLVTYYSNRRNFMDDEFSLIEDIEVRFNELNDVYTSSFETQALKIFDKYDQNYIILSDNSKEDYNITAIDYLGANCFEQVYNNQATIYKIKCELKTND